MHHSEQLKLFKKLALLTEYELKKKCDQLKRSADAGDARKQYQFAMACTRDCSIWKRPHDSYLAVKYFRLSAEQLYAPACCEYAFCILFKIGGVEWNKSVADSHIEQAKKVGYLSKLEKAKDPLSDYYLDATMSMVLG